MSFSVVITTFHDELGCYLTFNSLRSEVRPADVDFVIVADGGTEYQWEKLGVRCLRGTFGSPQASRDAGIKAAKFNDVLICESHVILHRPDDLVMAHRQLGGALTFPSRVNEGPSLFNVYGCETDWDGTLWYKHLTYTKKSPNPYRVSQFGNSCFVVDRDFYLKTGGYTDMLKGWGGEENFLCLKMWMLGRELWMVPSAWHAHFLTVGAHAGRTFDDEFKRNMQIVQFVIAGRTPSFPLTSEMVVERERVQAGPFQGDISKLRSHLASIGVM